MKKYRNFKCSDGHMTERRVEDDTLIVDCTECKGEAKRMLSAPKCFQNSATCSGKSPSAK